MDKIISEDEDITRFINQKSYFRSSDKTARHNAFMPNKYGETSVYRIIGITDFVIYEIGKKFVAEKQGKPLIGRADLSVSEILKCRLKVEPETQPHPRHANICNWTRERSETKMIAIELAAAARLHLLNSP